jgi:hypothetical protein
MIQNPDSDAIKNTTEVTPGHHIPDREILETENKFARLFSAAGGLKGRAESCLLHHHDGLVPA